MVEILEEAPDNEVRQQCMASIYRVLNDDDWLVFMNDHSTVSWICAMTTSRQHPMKGPPRMKKNVLSRIVFWHYLQLTGEGDQKLRQALDLTTQPCDDTTFVWVTHWARYGVTE